MTGPRNGALSGTLPGGGARNGLPEQDGYVYRGKQPLDDTNSYLCEAGCGRRLERHSGPRVAVCAVCRRTSALTEHEGRTAVRMGRADRIGGEAR